MNILIIGTGLTALWIKHRLRTDVSVKLLEKSRGVGGRMATRRTDAAKFDHGAQFYTLKSESQVADQLWAHEGLVSTWFELEGVARRKSPQGMTALAKFLARDADIVLEQKVDRLERRGEKWLVSTDSSSSFTADIVVLTAPIPQALELLAKNEINFDPALSSIKYAKALVGLFEQVETSAVFETYREHVNSDIFSIADQKAKGVSAIPAWTVTMTPEFSERFFDSTDDQALAALTNCVCNFDPSFNSQTGQLKKWRYSHPLSQYHAPFAEVAPGLLLAGDGFTRPSLNGALTSAEAVVEYINKK